MKFRSQREITQHSAICIMVRQSVASTLHHINDGTNAPWKKYGGRFLQEFRGEVHKFPLQKVSTAKRLDQWAKRLSWVFQIIGALPRTPMGSLQPFPRPPNWWGGGWLLLPKNRIPALGPSGLEPRGLGPLFSRPLRSNPEYAPAKPLELSVFKLFICTVVIVGNLALNERTCGPDLP